MITVIDYNAGNIKSVVNMFKKIGQSVNVTSQKDVIKNAEKLVLPGVGSFDYGMKMLKKLDLIDVIKERVITNKVPILGICLGAQLLGDKSEEGILKGLNFIPMEIKKFNKTQVGQGNKIPHMGWNKVKLINDSELFVNMNPETRFYFVHSYYMHPYDDKDISTITSFGSEFVSSVKKDNIYGVQFHPEKSHSYGMNLLESFAKNV